MDRAERGGHHVFDLENACLLRDLGVPESVVVFSAACEALYRTLIF